MGWPDDLTRDAGGAPVSAWLADRGLSVSLSATRGMAACALLRGGRVGVDVEAVDAAIDLTAVADQQFDPAAAALVIAAPPAERADRFFRLWTLLEAGLKALGTGFSQASPLHLTLDPPNLSGGEAAGLAWQALQLDCGEPWRLSVAMLLPEGAAPLIVAGPVAVSGR